eukprot:12215576-Karenia_brevis.AAC.1
MPVSQIALKDHPRARTQIRRTQALRLRVIIYEVSWLSAHCRSLSARRMHFAEGLPRSRRLVS